MCTRWVPGPGARCRACSGRRVGSSSGGTAPWAPASARCGHTQFLRLLTRETLLLYYLLYNWENWRFYLTFGWMVLLWDKSKGQTLNKELEPGTESRPQSENNIEERVSLGNRSRESLRDRAGEKLSIGKSDSFPCHPPPAPRPRNTSLASPVSNNGAEIPR